MAAQSMYAKSGETQEAVLPWHPVEIGGNTYSQEAVVFHEQLCSLAETVFEHGSKPGVHEARDIDCCGSDEIVPDSVLANEVFSP